MPSTRNTWSSSKTGRRKSIPESVSRGVRGASFGAFCGVFRPQGRPCRTQSPWHGRSVQSVPSRDEIPKIGFSSHDAAFHEETVKIGFVSLLGDSRFLYATLFYIMASILGILALFGHFLPPSLRWPVLAGSKFADPAGFAGCRRSQGVRIGQELTDSLSLRLPAWIVRAGPIVLANAIKRIRCQERMALGLEVTSYGLTSYDLLFFNKDQQIYVYKIQNWPQKHRG